MKIQQIPISPSYTKPSGVWIEYIDDLPFPEEFIPKIQQLIHIPPKQAGGNHKHPRNEAFIATSENLLLVWQDENGTIHKEKMKEKNKLKLFIVWSMTPHAIYNDSETENVVAIEFADDKQHDVEAVILV